MTTEKDYSLLRPFDLEAAKAGELLCDIDGNDKYKFAAGPDSNGKIVTIFEKDGAFVCPPPHSPSVFRMAPLAWVEGKPVYKGDVLWYKFGKRDVWQKVVARDRADEVNWMTCEDGIHRKVACMTWTYPKVKREGWINIYPNEITGISATTSDAYITREYADSGAFPGRIDCICIEWEE